MKPSETYCPFSGYNCQPRCALYDAQLEECMFAVALSGIGAYASLKLIQNLDTRDTDDPKMKLFRRIATEARSSIVEGAVQGWEHGQRELEKDHE